MTKLLQIGQSTAKEIDRPFGHIACTVGGVNYESTAHTKNGGSGCVRGSAARGAADGLFRHNFFLILTEDQANRAKAYAESCIGQPYVLGKVPSHQHGGDCSGFVSGIICAARGRAIMRLFSTATWLDLFDDFGFQRGLGAGMGPLGNGRFEIGVLDRPYPGTVVARNDPRTGHVRWIQARLNFAANNRHAALGGRPLDVDGIFGTLTDTVVKAFQQKHGLQSDGKCGPKTWAQLNNIR